MSKQRQRLSLDLPARVKQQIQRIAKAESRTITEIVRRSVDSYEAKANGQKSET